MALPKRRGSSSRRRRRQAGKKKQIFNEVTFDKKSGDLRRNHHVDLDSGVYNGRQVMPAA